MKIRNTLWIAALFVAAVPLQASTLGFTSPTGNYAIWDSFGSQTFNDAAPGSSSLNFTGALDQTISAAPPMGPTDGGEYFYTSTRATNWTLTGTSIEPTTALTLQIKLSTPVVTNISSFFSVSLNGNAYVGTPSVIASGITQTSGGNDVDFTVLEWSWTNLNIAASTPFNLTFTSPTGTPGPGNHVAVDGMQVTAVPEPSTYALMALGLGALVFLKIRRARA